MVFFIRDELEDEYEEMKNETIDQLKEVKTSLDKMEKGDVSLVDNVNAMQLVSLLNQMTAVMKRIEMICWGI